MSDKERFLEQEISYKALEDLVTKMRKKKTIAQRIGRKSRIEVDR